MMQNIASFITYVLLSVYGLYKIKSSVAGVNADFIIGFVSYLLGFLIWLYILKNNSLSLAFPVAAGSLIVATQFVGYLFLDEKMNLVKELGVGLVIIGVIMVYSYEK